MMVGLGLFFLEKCAGAGADLVAEVETAEENQQGGNGAEGEEPEAGGTGQGRGQDGVVEDIPGHLQAICGALSGL